MHEHESSINLFSLHDTDFITFLHVLFFFLSKFRHKKDSENEVDTGDDRDAIYDYDEKPRDPRFGFGDVEEEGSIARHLFKVKEFLECMYHRFQKLFRVHGVKVAANLLVDSYLVVVFRIN